MVLKILKMLIPCLFVFLSSGCGGGEKTLPNGYVEAPVEPPIEQTPVEPPIEQTPVEPPIEQTPVEPPIEQTPVEPPIEQTPVEPPIEQTPVEPPIEQTPVEPPIEWISLPEGFSISFYSKEVPGARSLSLGTNGTLFVGTRGSTVYALSDTDGDNYAETVRIIANDLHTPNGVAFRDGDLYVAEIYRILRYDEIEDRLSSPPDPEVIIDRLPTDRSHGWKFIRFGPDGKLYVPVGAPCNVCEIDEEDDELSYAAILRMDPDGSNLEVFGRGVRNTVGFDWHPQSDELWFTDNGRDNLGDDSPPDELNHAPEAGLHFGFPYCHGSNVQDPVFGSEDKLCNGFTAPKRELPAHVAALGMRFYTGSMFPSSWRNVIFIAEHGSWNRSVPIGYRVTSVRLNEAGEAVSYEVFAQGWLEPDGNVLGRPVDVLIAPDGALLVSDDRRGAIYRISR